MRPDFDTNVIRKYEALRNTSYQDGAGVWTIGYGHTGPEVGPGQTISDAQAEDLFSADLSWVMALIARTVKVPTNGGQYTAIASLIFNIGAGGWSSSTALKRLNNRNYIGCAEAMTWWNKITVNGQKVVSSGLINRRNKERALFLSEQAPTEHPRTRPQSVTGGEAKPAIKSKTQWLGLGGVLASIMGAWSQLKLGAPEIVDTLLPYLPYLLGLIFVAVMFNRWIDSRKGVH